jgi:hypothetical protein
MGLSTATQLGPYEILAGTGAGGLLPPMNVSF